MMDKDPHFNAIKNEGPDRIGHTILYDRLINEVAKHSICMIYHADMYLMPGALDQIEHKLEDKTIVSLTRIEPPLHPDGPEKMLMDFGIEPEEFKEGELLEWFKDVQLQQTTKITEGIFAPWAFYKKDFQEIGGHDPLYAPQSKEDSDIFNRFQLNGIKFKQTWGGCVYHMTCRGSRFADGAVRNPNGEVFMKNRETDEWLTQNQKATRNFIRKWGHFVKHDRFLKPIIPHKYDIGIILDNNNADLLHLLEPWCNSIYCGIGIGLRQSYITKEQSNTQFDLSKRVLPFHNEKNNEILVTIGSTFTQNDFDYIQQLSEILSDSGEPGFHGELGNITVEIFEKMNTYEKDLIICKKQ